MTSLPDRAVVELIAVENRKIERIIQIVAVVSDLIREVGDLRLEQRWTGLLPFPQSLQPLQRQVQPRKRGIYRLEQLHPPQALPVVLKTAVLPHAFGEHLFPG